jgi:23S rRNA (guanine2535-N1)-methyltransferase
MQKRWHRDAEAQRVEKMPYRFAVERADYSDLAGGKVFESFPNSPFFPVRLASEIFQRCLEIRARDGLNERITLYDPCCGGAYLLVTLTYLHWQHVGSVIGSDIDGDALELARRNLSLLTLEGLDNRVKHIESMIAQFGKASHVEALESAQRMKQQVARLQESHLITTSTHAADALNPAEVARNMNGRKIDVVITDVPYGNLSAWRNEDTAPHAADDPIRQMLEALLPVLTPQAVVAICSDKGQKAANDHYQRVDHFQIGKRRITLLRPRA